MNAELFPQDATSSVVIPLKDGLLQCFTCRFSNTPDYVGYGIIKSMPISFLSNEYTVPELALHMNPAETNL